MIHKFFKSNCCLCNFIEDIYRILHTYAWRQLKYAIKLPLITLFILAESRRCSNLIAINKNKDKKYIKT